MPKFWCCEILCARRPHAPGGIAVPRRSPRATLTILSFSVRSRSVHPCHMPVLSQPLSSPTIVLRQMQNPSGGYFQLTGSRHRRRPWRTNPALCGTISGQSTSRSALRPAGHAPRARGTRARVTPRTGRAHAGGLSPRRCCAKTCRLCRQLLPCLTGVCTSRNMSAGERAC